MKAAQCDATRWSAVEGLMKGGGKPSKEKEGRRDGGKEVSTT